MNDDAVMAEALTALGGDAEAAFYAWLAYRVLSSVLECGLMAIFMVLLFRWLRKLLEED